MAEVPADVGELPISERGLIALKIGGQESD